jgi:hypothetical protein
MADLIKVRPARKGMRLSHPVQGLLPDHGGEWPADQFTFRLEQDGDIRRVKDDPPPPPAEHDDADKKPAKGK